MQTTRLFTIALVSLLFSATATAQVFDSGPSDSALFTDVINHSSLFTFYGVFGGSTQVNVVGGSGVHLEASSVVEVNISGGSVGTGFDANSDSVVNISGGEVGASFSARSGSEVNISGGVVGTRFFAGSESVVNISGGSVGDIFIAVDGSSVNLFGSDFALNGALLNGLSVGEIFTIPDRDVTLSGLLDDGSTFSFHLRSDAQVGDSFFAPGAMLTVTLTPEPLLGDVNHDGVVNFMDIAPFISTLSAAVYLEQADMDQSGVVDFLDIQPFINLLFSQ